MCKSRSYKKIEQQKISKLKPRNKVRIFRKCIQDMSNRVKGFNKYYSEFQKEERGRTRQNKYLIKQQLPKSSQSWEKQPADP